MGLAYKLVVFRLFCAILGSVASAQQYTVTDLGVLSGDQSSVGGWLNSSGHVVGCSDPSNNGCSQNTSGQHAFFWQEGNRLQDLGTLPGGNISTAFGINDSDEIVGYSYTNEGTPHGFHYQFGVMEDLGTLVGGTMSQAVALNSSGMIVGASDYQNSGGNTAAVFWTSDGSIHQIPMLQGATSQATCGNNDFNEVAGNAVLSSTVSHAFLWTTAKGTKDLGTLPGGTRSFCGYINNSGVVFGGANSAKGKPQHCALWRKDGKKGKYVIHGLGTLAGGRFCGFFGANDRGQAVGASNTSSSRAVVWSAKTKLLDLNKLIPSNSGWVLNVASAINNSGQITGWGTINGATHAYLLTPTK